ncbi:MAG: LuxR C-terminal-related transcriptional regulator [Actinobacteria bacterium]|nr:LuxR C-terminal-related transcriptional regulator [Actinomycetota bacterium]
MAELAVEEVELVVDALVDAHLLKPGQPLRFVHPLVQSAIYRHMPQGLRSRRHRNAARLLAPAVGVDDDVARHLLRTAPADDPWVLEQLRAGGVRALEAGAPDVAITLLRRAIDETPTFLDPETLLRLGQAETLVRDRQALGHLQQAFVMAHDPLLRARAALPLSRALAYRRRYEESLGVLEDAIQATDELDGEAALRLKAERLWLMEISDLPVLGFVDEAERLASDLQGATHSERLALGHLGTAQLFRCRPHTEVRATAERALRDGQLLREEGPDSPSWVYTAALLWVVGDYAAAEHEMLRGEQATFDRGAVGPLVQIRGVRAWMSFELGELDRAEGLARDVLLRTYGQTSSGGRYARACLATVLVERGLAAEAGELLSWCEIPDRSRDRLDALLLHARAEQRLAAGDPGGVQDLLEVGRWCDERGIQNPGEWGWRTDVAPALAASGQEHLARRLAQEDVDRARTFGVPRPLGRALHAAALVAPPAERLALLTEAVDVLAQSPARLAQAKASLHLGVALRSAGRVPEAQQLLRSALALASTCRAQPVADDAHRLLLATGARPRRSAVLGPDALTATEREVATLAAQGATNREIATRLYVSVKAVEKHLRNTYAKLEIERRTGLAAALSSAESSDR